MIPSNNDSFLKINALKKLGFFMLVAIFTCLSCIVEEENKSANEEIIENDNDASRKSYYKSINLKVDELTKAIDLNPNDNKILIERAATLLRVGKYERALNDIELAMSIDSSDSQVHKIKGKALYGLNKFTKSIASYNRYIQLNPNDPKGYFERAYSYERGRFIPNNEDKAIEDFNKSIEVIAAKFNASPSDVLASKKLMRIIGQDTDIGSVYFGLGLAYIQNKEWRNALDAFENADKFHPNNKNTIRYIERLRKKIN